jgi:Bacterial SH3 domain
VIPDARQDIRHTCAAAGLDLMVIHVAATTTLTREDRAVALVRAFGALRQRDLVPLMNVSSASISRLVTTLLAARKLREQLFKDGAVGRPTEWLLAPEDDPPSYQQRQAIIASLPDVIAYLATTPSSPPVHPAAENPPNSTAGGPAHSAPDVPVLVCQEPIAQMASALWFGVAGKDAGASAEIAAPILGPDAAPPIASSVERFAPPRLTTPDAVSLTCRHIQSPIPPWERSQLRVRPRWQGRAIVRCGAASLALGAGQLLRLMLRLLILGGHVLWTGLRLVASGIQKLVWLIDDLNAIFIGRRWLVLGIAVAVVVGVLLGLRRQSDGITLPALSPPAEQTPTGMTASEIAPTALTATMSMQIRRAQVVDTGKDGLIVRDAPGGKRIGKLANGVAVVILGGPQSIADQEDPVWWNIQYDDMVGWVSGRFLHLHDTS